MLVSGALSQFDWDRAALLGIELQTEIKDHDFVQAQLECLIMASRSQFPVLQVSLVLSD